jgi:hypothetical protein
LLRAGTVMIAAALEAYMEDIFEAGVDLVFAAATADERESFKKNTSERLNNASVFKVNLLDFNLGIPWVIALEKFCRPGFLRSSTKLSPTTSRHEREQDLRETACAYCSTSLEKCSKSSLQRNGPRVFSRFSHSFRFTSQRPRTGWRGWPD